MPFFSRKKLSFNHFPVDILASQFTQRPLPVCTWSAHAPQSGPSPSPFPRCFHRLTTPTTPTGELFLFGGYVRLQESSDLYVLSTRDFSTTRMHTSGEGPDPRAAHGAALIGTTLLICGGIMEFHDDSLYLLNLVSLEWSRVVVNGPGPGSNDYHTTTLVGSKLYVFGGGKSTNNMWTIDLNHLTSQCVWESYEPSPGSEKPPGRCGHVSVTTENRIIIFGGCGDRYYNDTWSFDILTRKWTELQCTGSVPTPRSHHAAVLVDDAMYVFGGSFIPGACLDDLYVLQLSTQRWFKFHNVGRRPQGRWGHAMASDGTRVFLLGGYSSGAHAGDTSLIHVFDTKHIKYPESERFAANPNERAAKLAQKSSTGPPTQEQLQHPLAAQSERDHRIAQLTDELALKNALLEQAESNALEAARRADDRQLIMTSLVKQRDVQLVDVQASLKDMQASFKDMQAKLDESLLSRDQQIGQYEKELANIRAKLEANESELEAVRLRLTDGENGLTKNSAQTASGSVNRDEDQVIRRLKERVRAIEAEMTSKRWNEKRIEDMECRNEE